MKAIGYTRSLPIDDPQSLVDIELPQPTAAGHDLLVRIKAIAVNPVDYKVRQRSAPEDDSYKVLGWDVVGEVVATGDAVTRFEPGDSVYYAGDLNRQGGNAEYQLVDERLGHVIRRRGEDDQVPGMEAGGHHVQRVEGAGHEVDDRRSAGQILADR